VSVVSISELQRALQNQRLDIEIMRCIARMRSPNVSNLAEELGIDRKSIRFHLYKLKAEGCLRDRWVHSTTAAGFPNVCHEWQLTTKGERILHENGLIFHIF
jgi:predicted ArsR family transcriptional regulator